MDYMVANMVFTNVLLIHTGLMLGGVRWFNLHADASLVASDLQYLPDMLRSRKFPFLGFKKNYTGLQMCILRFAGYLHVRM